MTVVVPGRARQGPNGCEGRPLHIQDLMRAPDLVQLQVLHRGKKCEVGQSIPSSEQVIGPSGICEGDLALVQGAMVEEEGCKYHLLEFAAHLPQRMSGARSGRLFG